MILGFIVWLVLSALVGSWASKLKRSGGGYFFGALVLSPLIMAIILAFVGENKKAVEKENQQKIERKAELKESLNTSWKTAMKQNGFSEYLDSFEKNGIDSFDVLSALTDYDLEKLGMVNIGERKKFLMFVKELSAGKVKLTKYLDRDFTPTHKVKLITASDGISVRKKPDNTIEAFTKIPDGTEIEHLSTGETVELNKVKGNWFEVKTKDGVSGWVFSGSLEKL